MVKPLLTQAYVRERFDYHRDGYFTWKPHPSMPPNWHGRYVGQRAGYLLPGTRGGYVVRIDTISYGLHRVVFLYHHGYMPDEVDHIDMDPSNNRIENLRAATHQQNNCNKRRMKSNTSGYKGVRWRKDRAHWTAGITANGKDLYLGSFPTKQQAIEAYDKAALKPHGEFARLE
jgi:hypothetical protein